MNSPSISRYADFFSMLSKYHERMQCWTSGFLCDTRLVHLGPARYSAHINDSSSHPVRQSWSISPQPKATPRQLARWIRKDAHSQRPIWSPSETGGRTGHRSPEYTHPSSPTAGGSPLEEEAIVKTTRKKQHRAPSNRHGRKATVNGALSMGRAGCSRTDRIQFGK